jgi:transposase-like protein
MNKSNKFSPEVRERAVRMVQEHRGQYPSLWAAVESIAPKIGCVPQMLLEGIKRREVDTGVCDGVTTVEAERVKALEREVKELRRAKAGERVFRPGGARPRAQILMTFIDEHRGNHGVEPICKVVASRSVELSTPCCAAP